MSSRNLQPSDWGDEVPNYELANDRSATYRGILYEDGEFSKERWKELCKYVVGGIDNLPNDHKRGYFEPLFNRIFLAVERRTARIFARDVSEDSSKPELKQLLKEKYKNDSQFREMVDSKSNPDGKCGHQASHGDLDSDDRPDKSFGGLFIVDGEFRVQRLRGAMKAALRGRTRVRGPKPIDSEKSMRRATEVLESTINHKIRDCYKCRIGEFLTPAERFEQFKWLLNNDEEFKEILTEKHEEYKGVTGQQKNENKGSDENNSGDDGDDDGDSSQSNVGGSRYRQLMDIGVITDEFNVNWKKFRGLSLAFIKDIEYYEGPEEYFDIDVLVEAYYKWGLWKLEDEWVRFLQDKISAEEFRNQVEMLYTSNDDFREMAHEKYEYNQDVLAGNLGPGDWAPAQVALEGDVVLSNDTFANGEETTEAEEDETEQEYEEHDEEQPDGKDTETADSDESEEPEHVCSGCGKEFCDDRNFVRHLNDNPSHRKNAPTDETDGSDNSETSSKQENGSDGTLTAFAEEHGTTDDASGSESSGGGTLDDFSDDVGGEQGEVTNGQSKPEENLDSNGSEGGGSTDTDAVDELPDDIGSVDSSGSSSDKSDPESGRIENLVDFIEIYGTESDKNKVRRPKVVNEVIHGNSAKVPRFLAREYVDCVVTSPPYWQLRDYEGDIEDGWGDGEWEGQLGHEPTPDMFVSHLADVFDEIKPVMKPGGSLWVNLADTYAGKSGGHYESDDYDGESMGHDGNRPGLGVDGILPQKCLAGVPQRFMLEMINRGWILRNKIIWAKQVVFEDNDARGATMPTAAKDRVIEKAAEPIYHFVKQKDYYYNLDEIRRPHKTQPRDSEHYSENAKMTKTENHGDADVDLSRNFNEKEFYSEGGANLPRVWQVNLQQSSDEHYAAYPDTLVERPVKATCPEGGVVMDPFTGTGTTLRVASDMGRNYVGIEFSDKYIEIARNNITKGIQQTLVQQ